MFEHLLWWNRMEQRLDFAKRAPIEEIRDCWLRGAAMARMEYECRSAEYWHSVRVPK